MKNPTLLSRLAALRALVSLGVILGSAALAHAAATPFTPNSTWCGTLDQEAPGSTTLTITSSNGVQSEGNLTFQGTPFAVAITWDSSGAVQIKDKSNSGLSIQGLVTQPDGACSPDFQGSYSLPGPRGTSSGTISLLAANPIGLASDNPIDANIPSISIVPPDFQGFFETGGGVSGGLWLHDAAPAARPDGSRPSVSLVTGQATLGSAVFHYVLTFAPKPGDDGSFAFRLIGNSARADGSVAFLTLTGQFFPGSDRTAAGMKGGFQLTGVRGDLFDSGVFSLSAAR